MSRGQTVRLIGEQQRKLAHDLIDRAPAGAVVNIAEAKRTLDQSAKMWAMLSDVSRSKPDGRVHTADVWKALMMSACGYEVQFLMGLDGNPFPHGFKSSNLRKGQMHDLITFIQAYGDEKGVRWSEPNPHDRWGLGNSPLPA